MRKTRDYYDIEKWASDFRKGLEHVCEHKLYGHLRIFSGFPNECCNYTSDLLAEYLLRKGIERIRIQFIRSESDEEGYTHCWLMIDEQWFVDITADQFNGKSYFSKFGQIDKCIMEARNKGFYKIFEKKMECIRDFGIDSRSEEYELKKIYEEVVRFIEKM